MDTATQQSNNAIIDTERQKKAREYARKRRRLSFINMGIAALALLFIFWSELNIVLRNLLQPLNWQPVPGWYPWQVLVYLLILTLGYQVITFPLDYYGGFVLPHRYGLSTMTLRSWLADLLKGLVLSLILEILAIDPAESLKTFAKRAYVALLVSASQDEGSDPPRWSPLLRARGIRPDDGHRS